jgi:N-acetylglucosaminyl-diphospho-decaprenol L-rhamnosyltransferase
MTLDCLASLQREAAENAETQVVLLDSASNDGSIELLSTELKSREWEKWVHLVKLPENRGFSAANNAGFRAADNLARFDGFLLANSDTIFRPGAIAGLRDVLRNEQTVGLVGPQLEWPCGEAQVSCFRNISPWTELVTAAKTGPLSKRLPRGELVVSDPSNVEIEWISFACVLIRKEVVEAVGCMDEGFFMYFEDADYCRRARNAGWQIAFAPRSHVVHLRGGRTPNQFALEERRRRPDFYYRSRARYFAKFHGRTGPWRANLGWHLGRGVSLAREILGNKEPHIAAGEAFDIWKGALCGFAKDVGTRAC